MANRQRDTDLSKAHVLAPPPPVSTLAWLGAEIHSTFATRREHIKIRNSRTRHIMKEETTPDFPATMPREPGTTLLSRLRFPAALSTATAPASAATIHRGPPQSAAHPAIHHRSRPTRRLFTTQPRIQRYIIARGRPDASSLHRRASSDTSSLAADRTPLHYSQLRIQLYIIARGRPDASSVHSSPALRLQPTPLGKAQ
jgi:hypothetical protein